MRCNDHPGMKMEMRCWAQWTTCLGLLIATLYLASGQELSSAAVSSAVDPDLPAGEQDPVLAATPDLLDDDSVRCRLSGICEQPFPAAVGSCPDNLTAAEYELLGASQRDAVLACISDPAERAAKVVEAVAWSWKGYRDCAWGWDELQPLSCGGAHWVNLSLTLVDSLDTLYLAGLEKEFEEAAEWVIAELNVAAPGPVSLFETTIRIVGGLLSAHHLCAASHPHLSKGLGDKAVELGTRLLPALTSSPSGIPYSDVNLRTGAASAPLWANISSLSEVATLSLEFTHLSRLSGRPDFEDLALAVHDKLQTFVDQHGPLLPLYYNPVTGSRGTVGGSQTATLGARADSYYEYLLKQWLLTGKQPGSPLMARYVDAMRAVRSRLVRRTAPAAAGGLVFVGEQARAGAAASTKMDHLVCFLPGLLALGDLHGVSTVVEPMAPAGGAAQVPRDNSGRGDSTDPASGDDGSESGEAQADKGSQGSNISEDGAGSDTGGGSGLNGSSRGGSSERESLSELELLPDLELAELLAATCYELYRRTPSGLAPEIVHFSERAEDGGEEYPGKHLHDVGHGHFYIKPRDAHNLLRPETVESLYVLWKVTGRPRYRDWAWAIFRAFQRWCRVEGEEQCLLETAAGAGQTPGEEVEGAGPAVPAGGAATGGSSSSSSSGGGGQQAGVEAAPSGQQGLQQQQQQQQQQQAQESAAQAAGDLLGKLLAATEQPKHQQGRQHGEGQQGRQHGEHQQVHQGEGQQGQHGEGQQVHQGEGQQGLQQEHQQVHQGEGQQGGEASFGRDLLQQAVEAARLDPPFQAQQQQHQEQGQRAQHGQREGSQQQRQQRAGQQGVLLGRRQLQHWEQQQQQLQQEEQQQQQQQQEERCQQGRGQGLRAGGYTSLSSVLQVPPTRQDKMESFWVAETLKYLHLTFSEPPERCLDESCAESSAGGGESSGVPGGDAGRTRVSLWTQVYNTEAHPLPAVGPRKQHGVNPQAAHGAPAAAMPPSAPVVAEVVSKRSHGVHRGQGAADTAIRGAQGADKISGVAGGAGKAELARSSGDRDEL